MGFFYYKVSVWYDGKQEVESGFVFGESYVEAMTKISNYYGDEDIECIKHLQGFEPGMPLLMEEIKYIIEKEEAL